MCLKFPIYIPFFTLIFQLPVASVVILSKAVTHQHVCLFFVTSPVLQYSRRERIAFL